MPGRAVVTGAFSYIGAAVAAEMSSRGWQVRTLTNRRRPPAAAIEANPLIFDPAHLSGALEGADVLVNTYWIRLPHAGQTFDTAVERSGILLDAAASAGVRRLVHVSVSNASLGTDLGYYRGKAAVEDRVRALPLSRAIVRPTLVVGPGDVLTNNIAWLLRRFPFFPVPAAASRLQPVTLADAARIVAHAAEGDRDTEEDAAGPDAMTFLEYVRLVASACGLRRPIFAAPDWIALAGSRLLGPILGDVLLSREELLGLEHELLLSREPPLGREPIARWLREHGGLLGRRYANDMRRHFGAGSSDPVLDQSQLQM